MVVEEATPVEACAAGAETDRGRALRALIFNPVQLIPLAVAPVLTLLSASKK